MRLRDGVSPDVEENRAKRVASEEKRQG